MRSRLVAGLTLAVAGWMLASYEAESHPKDTRATGAACASCHVNPAGGPELTEAGTAWSKDKKKLPPKAGGATFVGDQKCRSCHVAQFAAWKETRHAGAMATLMAAHDTTVTAMAKKLKVKKPAKAAESADCVPCHVVGFGLASGYPAADSVKNAALGSVGCESCHGPGSKHVFAAPAMMRATIHGKVSEKTCLQCHTSVMSPKFDFATAKAGVHPVKASE